MRACCLVVLFACAESTPAPRVILDDPTDAPIAELDARQTRRFALGDAAFELVFREAQGLGPRFIRQSCTGCHENDSRGPGMVHRSADGTLLRPRALAGRGDTIPEDAQRRFGPPVFGRGYVEAVADAELERVARDQADHPHVSGRVPRLEDGTIGRFGLKSKLATLEGFVAEAYLNDMGITSPHRPHEEGEDAKPGIDLEADVVEQVADYVRMLAIPSRAETPGADLFEQVGCATCHVPTMRTRANHPIRQLAGIDAPIYSDLLLHDMGVDLADGIAEGPASGSEWRTSPLIGIRHMNAYLHDGRARTVAEAVRMHAGEARFAREAFGQLADEARGRLIRFVESL